MERTVQIPLEIWQDPVGDVLLIYSERECSVYFSCWTEAATPANFIGHLIFERAHGVRSFPREYLPYSSPAGDAKSWVMQVFGSEFIEEYLAYRKRHYPTGPVTEPSHFVVHGHDIYHEILADRFDVTTVSRNGLTDQRLLRLFSV